MKDAGSQAEARLYSIAFDGMWMETNIKGRRKWKQSDMKNRDIVTY